MYNNRVKALEIMMTFMKIGAFTFGSGYAMIALISEEVVKNKGWLSDDEMVDMLAISEATPGPIMVNVATFVGYRLAGVKGAVLATVGVILPSFVMILFVTGFLNCYADNVYVQYAFNGIRAGVLVLIAKAVINIQKNCQKDAFAYLMIVAAFCLVTFTGINVVCIIIAAAIIGNVYSMLAGEDEAK